MTSFAVTGLEPAFAVTGLEPAFSVTGVEPSFTITNNKATQPSFTVTGLGPGSAEQSFTITDAAQLLLRFDVQLVEAELMSRGVSTDQAFCLTRIVDWNSDELFRVFVRDAGWRVDDLEASLARRAAQPRRVVQAAAPPPVTETVPRARRVLFEQPSTNKRVKK